MKSHIFSQDLEVYGILIVRYSDHMKKNNEISWDFGLMEAQELVFWLKLL